MMEEILTLGAWAIIGLGILSVLAMLLIHYLAQRSQQHMAEQGQSNIINLVTMGVQGLIGTNTMKTIDESITTQRQLELDQLKKKETD